MYDINAHTSKQAAKPLSDHSGICNTINDIAAAAAARVVGVLYGIEV